MPSDYFVWNIGPMHQPRDQLFFHLFGVAHSPLRINADAFVKH
jgi:hypothetical protein